MTDEATGAFVPSHAEADRPGDEDLILTDEEFDDLETAEAVVTPISYSGQDFDVDGLVRRLNKGDIVVPSFGLEDDGVETAGFQRGFVWTRKQMDRFIESLLLGYPIPGLFLVRQQSDKRYLVLDGQQRLKTLQAFHKGVHDGKVFALINVADQFRNLTYEKLPEPLRRTLDDAFLQATVVSTDGSRESLEAVYQIFERLNSGGTQLTPHEIRVALFAGPLIGELERLNSLPSWRSMYGEKKNPRLRDQELILRVLALFTDLDRYSRPLKGFLNDYAGEHREMDDAVVGASTAFEHASDLLARGPGASAFRKGSGQVNAAQSEAIMVGLMNRITKAPITPEAVTDAVIKLTTDPEFDATTTRSTADELVVQTRIRIASDTFSEA
ncbi:DUF262 domain-containing protein [Microbacterium ureisolvens]|uniref:DUF262 domain-containing protein n=1 Tax=Microbacterium ureisolvens TaxID=2781186 RepID=A0ABS7I003_9MICO|nr:DUF262 domain-containing protein [Microbacterium ureisolvens]MBW9110658.1 DUF262 domain-containing protein [Microbacterium ureisolvens]